MSHRYAEITFVVQPRCPSSTPSASRLLCSRCFSEIHRNLTLRLSFCPIHGLAAEVVEVRATGYARAHEVPR
ncbi:MAG: hypothetical protein WA691_07265 [Thermoplasmata archaeon]